jgi:hypothetical protein
MTSGPGAPPLEPPAPPAGAARAIRQAAQTVASVWAQPMSPAEHNRALSQLHSILRDLGIATRSLAHYQTTGHPADPAPPGFPQHVAASAERLLDACQHLDDVLAAEGLGSVPDLDESGAMLCQAARAAITAWRHPVGTSTERDTTIEQFITAVGFLAAAALSLTADARRRHTISLRAVAASMTGVTACLSKALPADASAHADPEIPRATTRHSRQIGR